MAADRTGSAGTGRCLVSAGKVKRARASKPRPVEWSTTVAERLKAAMNGDDKQIRAEVQSGAAQLLDWGGDLLTVVRIEGSEAVYCCVAGRNLARWLPHLVSYARQQGCQSIRWHAARRGIGRITRQLGATIVGTDDSGQQIYRMVINGR